MIKHGDLIKAMQYCIDPNKETDECNNCLSDVCPYAELGKEDEYGSECMDSLMRDALIYIHQQDRKINKLVGKIQGLKYGINMKKQWAAKKQEAEWE